MPRHLISDVHEWINEIPTVPIYYLAKPQPRERAWHDQRGKKTLLSLTLVWRVKRRRRCRISGSESAFEIPLLLMSLYLSCHVCYVPVISLAGEVARWGVWLGRHIC